jgi:hypothetical protein
MIFLLIHALNRLPALLHLPTGVWVPYVFSLLYYHVALAIALGGGDRKFKWSLINFEAVLTHIACVTVVMSLSFGKHYVPLLGLVRYFVPAIAPFEKNWLLTCAKRKGEVDREAKVPLTSTYEVNGEVPAALAGVATQTYQFISSEQSVTVVGSGEEYEEFLGEMRQGKRPFKKPGRSVAEEYQCWLAARLKLKARAAAAQRA